MDGFALRALAGNPLNQLDSNFMRGRRNASKEIEFRRPEVRQICQQDSRERHASPQEGNPQVRQRRQGWKGNQPQTGHCDWTFRSAQEGRQGTEEVQLAPDKAPGKIITYVVLRSRKQVEGLCVPLEALMFIGFRQRIPPIGYVPGSMFSLYDILARCTVYSSFGMSEFSVNTLKPSPVISVRRKTPGSVSLTSRVPCN